jgi:cob(I)alamin adenosyltransferase
MKIYTKTGDKGTSGLIGNTRTSKDDIRLEAYGTIDELNSFIGLLLAEGLDANDNAFVSDIQHRLFNIGSYLATDQSAVKTPPSLPVSESVILDVERQIDQISAQLPQINKFVLPGGNKTSALSHVCRTVCRRAERNIVRVSHSYEVHPILITYVNRLSDYFFILARKCCLTDHSEIFWDNTK